MEQTRRGEDRISWEALIVLGRRSGVRVGGAAGWNPPAVNGRDGRCRSRHKEDAEVARLERALRTMTGMNLNMSSPTPSHRPVLT
jgi:hypothetical protein